MVKIRNSHRKLKNEPLKNQAELHYAKMNGIALYAPYQSEMTRLGNLIPEFGAALINAKLGGTDRTAVKNKSQDDIIALLDGIIKQLELDTKDMPQELAKAFIEGAGFEIVDAKSKTQTVKKQVTFLNMPTNFLVTDEKKIGAARFTWDMDDDAITYCIETEETDGHWSAIGYSDESGLVLTGFPSKATKNFRLRAISTGTIVSDYSAIVTVWIS
jgi:hypothetical protein